MDSNDSKNWCLVVTLCLFNERNIIHLNVNCACRKPDKNEVLTEQEKTEADLLNHGLELYKGYFLCPAS